MTLKEQEAALFKEWKKEYDVFTYDGLFDEKEFLAQPIKILYILKEANWPGLEDDLHLVDWLLSEKSSTYWKTWNNIARWTQALTIGGEYPRNVSRHDKSYWLRKVAFVDLKKVPGGSRADKEQVREHVSQDKDFIKKQISIYSPDIIICCGRGNGKNADLLYEFVFQENGNPEWSKTPVGDKYNYFYVSINGKNVPVVSFVHPQMIASHAKLEQYYNDMLTIKQSLLKI